MYQVDGADIADNYLQYHSNFSREASNRYGRQLIVLISEWFKAVKNDPALCCNTRHSNGHFNCMDGQIIYENISNTSVLVVGAGGLGSPALLYLGASGIGSIGIVDGDSVEISNLHRQIIHNEESVGINKAESAESAIKTLNSSIICKSYPYRLSVDNAEDLIGRYDIVLDCTDDISTKYYEII